MVGSASIIVLRKMPGTRPSMLCTTSLGVPMSLATLSKSRSTAAGSLASQAYRRTPCFFSRISRTALSGFRAATATRMPFFENSLAQLELMPGPPPTMTAASWTEDLSDWVMFRARRIAGRASMAGESRLALLDERAHRLLVVESPRRPDHVRGLIIHGVE